jgi:hypothetical protein
VIGSDTAGMRARPWTDELITERTTLWASRSYFATGAAGNLARGVYVVLASLEAAGVRFTGPLGGGVGLVARGVDAAGRDIAVKVGPRTFCVPEATLFATGTGLTPTLLDSGVVSDDVGWLITEWAGETPPFSTLPAAGLLSIAEDFVDLCRGVAIVPKPNQHTHEAARARERVEEMQAGAGANALYRTFTETLGYRSRERAALLQELDRVVSCLPEGPIDSVLTHGDLHEGNLLLDGTGRLRVIDPKLVSGDLCMEAAYLSVMLRGQDGHRLGRVEEVQEEAAARHWAEPARVEQWAKLIAACRAISWWYNASGSEEEVRRAVTYALREARY